MHFTLSGESTEAAKEKDGNKLRLIVSSVIHDCDKELEELRKLADEKYPYLSGLIKVSL